MFKSVINLDVSLMCKDSVLNAICAINCFNSKYLNYNHHNAFASVCCIDKEALLAFANEFD